jgi:hypothetical protein
VVSHDTAAATKCGLQEREVACRGSGRLAHTLTKCRTESDVFGRAVSESDMLNANAVRRTSRMSLRIKRDRKMYVRRRAWELAESGRFSGWLSIEFELRFFEGFPKARIWLVGPNRKELNNLCRHARIRKSASTSTEATK